MSRRAVQKLVEGYILRLKLDPNVTVHSLRVTAITTARERGSDIIDLQELAGHADPRTTLTYIKVGDRLTKSPAYLIADYSKTARATAAVPVALLHILRGLLD